MMRTLLFIVLSIVLFACQNGNNDNATTKLEAERWQTVMDNHDVVMPLMGSTNKVRKDLKKIKETDNALSTTDATQLDELITNLNQADEDMMTWMNGFQQLKKLRASKSHQEIMTYLEDQEKTIKKVGEDMTNSIRAGRAFIQQYSK